MHDCLHPCSHTLTQANHNVIGWSLNKLTYLSRRKLHTEIITLRGSWSVLNRQVLD